MKKSLNFRLLSWAALSILVVVICLCAYNGNTLYKELMKKAELESAGSAKSIATNVEPKIEQMYELNRTIARVFSQVKRKNHPIAPSRDQFIEILKTHIMVYPGILGLNTGWEPNAFDGNDAANVNKPPSDSTGRFIPYVTRGADGKPAVEALKDYEKEGDGDYYRLPRQLKKDVVVKPYVYKVNGVDTLLITLTSPIVIDDVFYGEVGADVELSFFQKLTENADLPSGSKVIIYNGEGTIVGFTGENSLISKNIFQEKIENYTTFSKDRLLNEKEWSKLDDKNLSVLSSFKVGPEKWYIEIVIPKASITTPIYQQIAVQASLGLVIGLIALIAGFFLIRQITGNIIALSERLKDSAGNTRNGSVSVKDASFQVSSATQQQASAIQETAATLDEITAMVTKSVDNAKTSSDQADNSYSIAAEGKKTVEEMRQSMNEIRQSNQDIAKQIETSNKEIEGIIRVIQDISDKTKIINDIVFQTKLLSFNASVEAARAGDQGKGFAVVAEEVGNLASKSGESSKEINELLEKSIRSVETTINETRRSVIGLVGQGQAKVDQGTQVAERCGKILDSIVVNVSTVKNLMADVTIAAEEQSKGIKNISEAMNMLDQATQGNTRTVSITASESERLFKEADNLNDIISELESEVFGRKAS